MPKVHFVKAARKDNSVVKAGESYYWWQFRHGGKRYSKTAPRRSQLTQSEKLGKAYELSERLEGIVRDGERSKEWLQEAVENATDEFQQISEEVRELANEYRESAESIRASFSESPTADECEEKRSCSVRSSRSAAWPWPLSASHCWQSSIWANVAGKGGAAGSG